MSSAYLNRSDRLLLEQQIRHLDSIQRTITDMRSVLTRRMRRMVSERNISTDFAREDISTYSLGLPTEYDQNPPISRVSPPPVRRDEEPGRRPEEIVQTSRNLFESFRMMDVDETDTDDGDWIDAHVRTNLPLNRMDGGTRIHMITGNQSGNHTLPMYKSKVIKKKDLAQSMDQVCGICLEHHTKQESVLCNCTHEFGQECLKTWTDTCQRNRQNTNCPTCRQSLTLITSFRARAAPRKKTAET